MAEAWLEVRPGDVLDVLLVSTLFYVVIVWMRRARAGLPLVGMAILGGVYLAARQLDLHLTAWIFQGFFAIFVIILVVIYQRELRQLFERIAVVGLARRPADRPSSDTRDCVLRAVREFQRDRIGALIVLCGREPVERFLEGGVALDGRVSDALLASLFDPHSSGHDGALVVRGDRIVAFSAHLPLSTDFAQLGNRGTRHGAALGLAERTDALCLVVSEERGSISIARDGVLRTISDPSQLERELGDFVESLEPGLSRGRRLLRGLREHWVERLAALALACGLWAAFVPGSQVLEQTFDVPIQIENLPPGFTVEKIEPSEAELRLSGTRRDFFLLDRATVDVRIDATAVGMGRRTFEIDREDLVLPAGFDLVEVKPSRVRVSVKMMRETPGAEERPPGSAPRTGNGAGRSSAQPGVASR
ncbi:Cyclic di-AMP synthase CdaA [Myxococcaceae bacterium]|nr:Cyclic di-AMP synthase CdaA [Myxococcaceae bacterium]